MGEKGNLAIDDPLLALDAIPLDAIKSSPETVGAWLDTYLKFREAREATSEVPDVPETSRVDGEADATIPKADDPGSTTGI